jgi:uncharacterized protein
MMKFLMAVTAVAAVGLAQAQTVAPAGKKDMAAKVLVLLKADLEGLAQQLVAQPAMVMQQRAIAALPSVPADRRDAVARDIEADLRKYVDDTSPAVRDRAVKLAPSTIGPLLEERFSEDELRQIAAFLESPVNRKFQQLFPEMRKALAEKLVADSRGEIEPKLRALEQTVGKRLGAPAPGPGPGPAPSASPSPKK